MQRLFRERPSEVMLSGPAGTGKSRGILEYLHTLLWQHPGAKALVVRRTAVSLTASGMETFRKQVLPPYAKWVTFFGGNQQEPAAFRYVNGSRLVMGGLDKSSKVMSTEYDVAYVQEAIEIDEAAWEDVSTRLRNGVLPFQQLIGDCNPGPPSHWIKQRADRRQLALWETRHVDNPRLWDGGRWTEYGMAYMARLDALTGVRRKRLRDGIWAAAEGMVYEGWDPALHLIDPFPIPHDWPRYLAVDFGFTNPFVCQWWAEDPDGRLYRYREIYRSQRLVEEHAADIRRLWAGEPPVRAIVCDHDAEGRATLEKHLGRGTVAARKAVQEGVQAVAARLKPAADGKPRLFLLRDALVERDPDRDEARRPCATEEEAESYVWDTRAGRKRGEEPFPEDDHGMDAMRYMVMYRERRGGGMPKETAGGRDRTHMGAIRGQEF